MSDLTMVVTWEFEVDNVGTHADAALQAVRAMLDKATRWPMCLSVDGESVTLESVDALTFSEPHACDDCGVIYDEASGEGYMGLCPDCADRSEGDES